MGSPQDKRQLIREAGASSSWEDDEFRSNPATFWPLLDAEPVAAEPLSGLRPGTKVDATLVIRAIEQRGGDYPHTILQVGNASGCLPSAPIWASDRHRLDGLSPGQAIRLRGSIGQWRDRPQIIIESLEPIPASIAPWPLLLPTVGDPAPWWRIIDMLRDGIQSPHLRSVVAIFFDDNDFRSRFQQCPGSLSGHHGKIGGLLQHTCEVAHFSHTLAETVSRRVAELVVAGALLHDIGKLPAYRWDGTFRMTIPGRVIGHVVLGTLMLDRAWHQAATRPCTSEELELLHHLILSHHGQLEHGAPVPPMTLEAELLHQADRASATGSSMRDALLHDANFTSGEEISDRGLWQLDRRRVWRRQCGWGSEADPEKRSDRQA